MLKKSNFLFVRALYALLLVSLLYSCKSRPVRKKLPDLSALDGLEATPQNTADLQPFYTSDTVLVSNSERKKFLSIAMPYAIYDSLAISVVTNYKPFAVPLLTQWIQQQDEKGVIIDLRNSEDANCSRADYVLTKQLPTTVLSIPVVFLWDKTAAYRANLFINELKELPDFKYTFISAQDNSGTSGCFTNSKPAF
jgi:hypothetical protein